MVKQIVYTGHLEGSPLLCGKWDIGGRCIILPKLFSSNIFIVKQICKNLTYEVNIFSSFLLHLSMHPNPNVSEAIILISSLETVPPPDICQSLGLQRIMEENCPDQMFKTVTVPTKYVMEQNQS